MTLIALLAGAAALAMASPIAMGGRSKELEGHVGRPSASPDGARIVFIHSAAADGIREIYVANVDGSQVKQLTSDGRTKKSPVWSPDGERIAYHALLGPDRAAIFSIRPDGSDSIQLTDASELSLDPWWSPDGKTIVFYSNRESKNFQIFTMGADGSNVRRLHESGGNDVHPRFGRDGRIVFSSDRTGDGGYDLYVMGCDGTAVRRLTSGPGNDSAPTWSPDGREIAFFSNRDDPSLSAAGDYNLYLIDADGRNLRRLTHLAGQELFPTWFPAGRRLIFDVFPPDGSEDPDAPVGLYTVDLDAGSTIERIVLRK